MWKTILTIAVQLGLGNWAKRKARELAGKLEDKARERFDRVITSAQEKAHADYSKAIDKAESLYRVGTK